MPRIVFFDGTCHLCHRSVRFIIRRDKRRKFRFAPLQGITARQLLGLQPAEQENPDSLLLLEAGKLHRESGAVLHIARQLPGIWKLSIILFIIPAPLRNVLYRFVARRRYRWFGQSAQCMLPERGFEDLFLP